MSLNDLNAEQKKAVIITSNNLLVSACPGSGKTRLLQEKAEYILNKDPSANIVAVTFTKDSADELFKRIATAVGPDKKKRVTTGTFHSLAQKQLKLSGKKINLLIGANRNHLIKRIWDRHGQDMDLDEAFDAIEKYKSTLIDYDNLPDNDETAIFIRYQEELKKNNKVDFSDLLIDAVDGMRNGSIKPYQTTYMFVDEFQDVDDIQYHWVREHYKAGSYITVVGDEDQSIYSFRNALGYQGMIDYEKAFKSKKVLLGLNYRCRAEILALGDRLIKNNENRNVKKLIASKGKGGNIDYFEFTTNEGEINKLIDIIGSDPKEYGSWGVLTRTNKGMDKIEADLSCYGIPYDRHGGTPIWKAPVVEHYFNFLIALEEKNDPFAINQILSWAWFDERDLEKINHAYKGDLLQMWNPSIEQPKVELTGAAIKKYKDFSYNFKIWAKGIRKKRYEMVVFSVMDWMKHQDILPKDEALLDISSSALSRFTGVSLKKRIIKLTTGERKAEKGKVQLYTLHKSKGLEFKNVWMPQFEEGTLPHSDSSIAEERRLAYVGVTRAEERLVISSVKNRATPSRFLSEMGFI